MRIRTAIACAAFALAACSAGGGTPSESDARTVYEGWMAQYNDLKPYRLVSFKKTDGLQREVFGVQTYDLEFEAVIERVADEICPAWLARRCKNEKAGARQTKTGKITYRKSEAGWRANKRIH